jgi:ribosomal RNA-processing protein 9
MKRSRIKGNGSTPTQKRQRPPQGSSRRKVKSSVKFHFDEDISDGGDSDEDVFTSGGKPSATVEMVEEESDNETATEKRVRLAKDLLRSYENEAARDRRSSFDGDDAQDNLDENDPFFNSKDTPQRGITGERQDTAITDAISQRLHDDVRHATGKIFRQCADVLTTCDASEVSNAFHHGHDKAPTCITLSHDESNAWTGSKDCSVIRWDVETGKRIAKYPGRHMTRANRNTKSGKKIHATGHSDEVLAIACTTDGKYVASAGRDSTIRLWDARSNKLLDTFKGHRDIISTLTFQDYTHTLYSGSHDRTVKIWNMTERMYVDTLFGHQAEVTSISCLRKERVVR